MYKMYSKVTKKFGIKQGEWGDEVTVSLRQGYG